MHVLVPALDVDATLDVIVVRVVPVLAVVPKQESVVPVPSLDRLPGAGAVVVPVV